jgi:signal transduction histidine kinase
MVLDSGLRVVTANRSFYAAFQLSAEKVEKQKIFDLAGGSWNIPALRKLLEEIAASYADSKERGIDFRAEIKPSTPESFSGDARLLRGAIANLIENAFQAAPGGNVRLASYGVDSKVVVSVDDDGPGVAPEVLSKIFDPYFSTKSSGTGLGLAITRKAIEEHGGSVHAENLNPGFRISIELPVR